MSIQQPKQVELTRPFVVGGVGNRLLPADIRALENGIDSAFRAIAADAGLRLGDLVLEVSLAEGADRLLVHSARRLGVPYRCILPCPPACFAEDFDNPSSIETFESLLSAACSVTFPDFDPTEKSRGYLWASRHILSQARVLLAVWDGEPGNGPGGTAHSIEVARDREIPVLWIPTNAPLELVRLKSLVRETS